MKQGIKILVFREPDEDGLFEFKIKVSNSNTYSTLLVWGYHNTFHEFANELIMFPIDINHKVKYELGQEGNEREIKWSYYLLMDVFFHFSSGKAAIKIISNNKSEIPFYERAEFYLKAEPASINKLGISLKNWNPNIDKEFEWIPYEG